MIWSKSRASTVHNGENVSTNIVDVMHSAQLVVEQQQQQQQPEVNLLPLVHCNRLVQPGSFANQRLLLLVSEVCLKSSIQEAYYNLDKVLSWSVEFREEESSNRKAYEERKKGAEKESLVIEYDKEDKKEEEAEEVLDVYNRKL